ncbi:reverse transcriptase-like protein [Plakobranchus ocellatus]|uniref:Reverse transcriptase-like protein n=1 Tax=Plakobranchus ocellatus TaxID=259542 RepID=A0AAV4ADZ6_9GAST|nr:reverse transcriptase-like protein [Plakobranchus ocellatus]
MRRLKKALERRHMASNRTFEVEFRENELDIALRKGKTGKAPGFDGVRQDMLLAYFGPSAKGTLLNLPNRTWRSGELRRAWRTVVMVPILKKGKCATAAKSYRPISLTFAISMECMVNARLYYYLEQAPALTSPSQDFGDTKQRWTS